MLLTFNQNNFRHLLNTDCHSLFGRPLGLPLFFIYLFIYFHCYYYAVKLYQRPGLVKASDLWMCQAFVILSGLILQQGSASSSELHVKSFIVLILSSDFYALHWLPSYPPVPLPMERQQKANGSTPDTGWIYYAASKPSHVWISAETRSLQMKIQTQTASSRFWNATRWLDFQAEIALKTSQ